MTASVLGSISLGYQLLWNRQRQPVAVQLFVNTDATVPVDSHHLLKVLQEHWAHAAPALLLRVQSPRLLLDLLDHGIATAPGLVIPQHLLEEPSVLQRVQHAHARGLSMVWHGATGHQPATELQALFARGMIHLSADDALQGLRVLLQQQNGTAPSLHSPIDPQQIYEGVASADLAQHCLDQQVAWALAGWPVDEVLHRQGPQTLPPGVGSVRRLITAIDADASLDRIEQILNEEPLLTYRFLRHINAAAMGLRHKIESLRRGLMVLGFSAIKVWAQDQLSTASEDLNLQPIRIALVTRAHLMERLLDAGEEDDLRREVYLCGLLSQMDSLLNEPLPVALQRLPLPERVEAALLQQSGPYRPYLEIATALESANTRTIQALCEQYEISLEDVNRALLKTLAALDSHATA